MVTSSLLSDALTFDDLPGWAEDDHAAALDAFLKSAQKMQEKPPKTRALGLNGEALSEIGGWLMSLDEGVLGNEARLFFEDHFVPRLIQPSEKAKSDDRGFVTGYYEPEVLGSRIKSERFSAPLLRRPHDLVRVADLAEEDVPKDWDPEIRFARQLADGIGPYHNRQAISSGAVADQELEIVYLEDPVDAFFIHIQGSARIRLDEGGIMRVSYAAKTGHAYTAIGRELIKRGEIAREKMSMEAIRSWLGDNPDQQDEVMWQNQSYIFFDEIENLDPEDGPIGAANVPLSSMRSMAVDRLLHTFGSPIFLNANLQGGFQHLMIGQDTGSAIVGPARGDIYFGSGLEAEKIAGAVQHAADFYLLWPKNQPL
ncbi:MAG: MltA domain-containing protein [Hyphomicrobiales bacterium]